MIDGIDSVRLFPSIMFNPLNCSASFSQISCGLICGSQRTRNFPFCAIYPSAVVERSTEQCESNRMMVSFKISFETIQTLAGNALDCVTIVVYKRKQTRLVMKSDEEYYSFQGIRGYQLAALSSSM